MLTKVIFLVAALYAQNVCSSLYQGPTALPVVLHNGYLADTHEVAAAKSAHLNTLSHQSHGGSYEDSHHNQHGHHGDLRYHGPIAIPHVLHDGHIADTHEVATAKSAHLAAVAKARSHGGYHRGGAYNSHYDGGYDHASYHGPIAIPHVLHDGYIADTHEVAAAKAEHFAAVAKARSHGHDYSGQYASGYVHHSGSSGAHHGYGAHTSYHGPIAIPHVLHDGHIADTHEVATAKSAHLAAVAKARSHGGHHHGGAYNGHYAARYVHHSGPSGVVLHGSTIHSNYHGPIAKPLVLPSGYLADAQEVAYAKQHHLQAVDNVGNHEYNHHNHHY